MRERLADARYFFGGRMASNRAPRRRDRDIDVRISGVQLNRGAQREAARTPPEIG